MEPYRGSPADIKGIVFSDLDGTILDNSKSSIPESALLAIEQIKNNGYKFVLSTGRDMRTHYSVRYTDIIKPDAVINSNGARITIGDEELFHHYFEEDLVRRLYEFCRERGYCIGVSVEGEDFFLSPEKKYAAEKTYKKKIVRNFVPFEGIFERGIRINAMSYAGDLEVEKPIVEAAFPEIELLPFVGGVGADLIERGYTKAEGLKRVCDYYGVDVSKTLAIGDSSNDIPILKAARIGIAMGGSDREAMAAADYVTDTIANDGYYKAMKHFGII